MDFGALPPEVNSGRMYAGAGPATLLAAAAAWEASAAELSTAAAGYESVLTTLTSEWLGPTSTAMAAAVAPYVAWLRLTAEQCEQTGLQATAATAAYETAYAMTVPPPVIAANRAQLMTLVATNLLGQNTPAIMATEAQYGEMWAQDAGAMYTYAASSASATTFAAFTAPPQTTNPGGGTGQAGAVAQSAGAQAGGHVQAAMSSVPQALQSLSGPGSSSGLSQAAMGTGASLGSSGASAPLRALSSLTGTGKTATKGASTGVGTATGLAAALGGGSSGADAAGLASDVAGLGADGAGLGADGGGIGIDLYGLSLDFTGVNSIEGAEGLGGLAPAGGLGGLGAGATASLGQGTPLGTLSVPPAWGQTVSAVTPLAPFDAGVLPASTGATPPMPSGAGVSKLPLGAMVGRESDGGVHRIGYRPSLFPRSPVAG